MSIKESAESFRHPCRCGSDMSPEGHRIAKTNGSKLWIKVSDLPQGGSDRIREQYGSRGIFARAQVKNGVLTQTKTGAEYVDREKALLSLYLLEPGAQLYRLGDGWYVPSKRLGHWGIDGTVTPPDNVKIFASVEEDGSIVHRKRTIGNGHEFVELIWLVRNFPTRRQELLASFGPDVPEYPTYAIAGKGVDRFMTTADLRRLAESIGSPLPEGCDREVLCGKHIPKKYMVAASVQGDVVSPVNLKNGASTYFVDVRWLDKAIPAASSLLQDSSPTVPFVTGSHPPNLGTKSFGSKDEPKVHTTVKCGITHVLKKREWRACLENFVMDITRAVRFGALAISLTVATTLRTNGGRFPRDWYLVDDGAKESQNVHHAMQRANRGNVLENKGGRTRLPPDAGRRLAPTRDLLRRVAMRPSQREQRPEGRGQQVRDVSAQLHREPRVFSCRHATQVAGDSRRCGV